MAADKFVERLGSRLGRRNFLVKTGASSVAALYLLLGGKPRTASASGCCNLCQADSQCSCSGCTWQWTCCFTGYFWYCVECYHAGYSCNGFCEGIQCSYSTLAACCC